LAIANHQPIPEGNQPHQTMMAWLSSLFVKNAQASIVPNGCLTRLVGYNQTKEAWEVLKLTTDESEACAMNFVVAGDYYISQMDAFKLDGGYCNLLMMRKTDGKLFCGLEAKPTQYALPNKIEVSSNGKYGLASVSATPLTASTFCETTPYPGCTPFYSLDWTKQSLELLRLDLKPANGIPAIKVIWATLNNGLLAQITDLALTNAGNAFVFYSYEVYRYRKLND
jgi:hypothetical protein